MLESPLQKQNGCIVSALETVDRRASVVHRLEQDIEHREESGDDAENRAGVRDFRRQRSLRWYLTDTTDMHWSFSLLFVHSPPQCGFKQRCHTHRSHVSGIQAILY